MIDQKQIPPEVVEAAADVLRVSGLRAYEDAIRAAIAAALNAWPGMINGKAMTDFEGVVPALILPLTEKRDEPQTDRRYNVAERLFGDE